MSASVLVFTWNTEGIHFCETTSETAAIRARSGVRGMMKGGCSIAEFLPSLISKINEVKPAIVFFTTQGGASSGTYLHSEALHDSVIDSGYNIYVSRDASFKLTGSEVSIRSSVFIRADVFPMYSENRKDIEQYHRNSQEIITYNNGESFCKAIVTYVKNSNYGTTALIATHIIHGSTITRDLSNLSAELAMGTILNLAVDKRPTPRRFIIAGDLGYMIENVPEGATLQQILSMDKLTKTLGKETLAGVKEGVDGRGINFPPTWSMNQDTRGRCSELKTFDKSCYKDVAWRDRVLYGEKIDSEQILTCTSYGLFNHPSMAESHHAAIIATFKLMPLHRNMTAGRSNLIPTSGTSMYTN